MKQSELMKTLADYAKSINTGEATTKDWNIAKQAVESAKQAGSVDPEGAAMIGKRVSTAFLNQNRTPELKDLTDKIVEKGGSVSRFAEEEAPAASDLLTATSKAGSKLKSFGPLLGMLGAGALAYGAGSKAMAGDYQGAALDAGKALVPPGVSEALSTDVGEGSDITNKQEKPFDFSPFQVKNLQNQANPAIDNSKLDTSSLQHYQGQPIDATQTAEAPARYAGLKALLDKKEKP